MPKQQQNRRKLDRYLESQGLLNYQTKGLSQQQVAQRYQQAGVNVNQKWADQVYGDRPQGEAPVPATGTYWQSEKGEPRPGNMPNFLPPKGPNLAINPSSGLAVKFPKGYEPPFRPGKTNWDVIDARFQQVLGDKFEPYQGYTPGGIKGPATVQDALNGSVNWSDVDLSQRKSILADPKFYSQNQITSYSPALQQQILADPNFDWSRLPKWQKVYFDISSNPKIMASPMALAGWQAGRPLGIVGSAIGAAAGYGLGVVGGEQYDPTKGIREQPSLAAGGMRLLNFLSEGAEMGVGYAGQLADATIAGLQGNKQAAQAARDMLTDPATRKAAMEAGRVVYEYSDTGGRHLANVLQMLAGEAPLALFSDDPHLAQPGQDFVIGALMPVNKEAAATGKIDPLTGKPAYVTDVMQVLMNARHEIRDEINQGGDPDGVVLKYIQDAGIYVGSQVQDLAWQSKFDPLNVLPETEAAATGIAAKVTGHEVAAAAFLGSNAPLEGARRYKTLVQTGMAKVIDPSFRVDQMGGFSRFVAGINDRGQVRAGPFSNQGLLDKPSKTGWIENVTSLTPESRAQLGANMFYDNMGTLLTQFEDPREAGKYLLALADNDMETWAQLGSQFADSPEFYTVLPALQAFNASELDGIVGSWETTRTNRESLLKIADILGQEPAKLLDDLAARGTKEEDFARIVGRLQESKSPQAKVLLDEIANKRFTADTLSEIVNVFTGEDPQPWHIGQWRAQVLDKLGTHFDQWATKYLGLKPDSGVFRFSHLMKSAQSVLLLGGSPGYAITNGLSNMVHRAATGIYGYLTPTQINSWMDRFGVKPARFEEGFGMAGAVEGTQTTVINEAMRAAKRGEGGIQTAHDLVNRVARKMPFNRLSSWFESVESKQGFVIAMKQFWSQSWRRGVGISKMTPELAQAVQSAGINPDHIYAAIEAGMNQEDVARAFFGRQQDQQARSLIHDAAQKIGISTSEAATMLEKTGILDALDGYLKGAGTKQKLQLAFERAARRAQDEIDIAASRDAIARAEHVKQRVGIEGAKALTDIITDVEMQGIEKWHEHYQRMGEAAEALDTVEPSERGRLWDLKYQESNHEFRRFNSLRGSTYLGIVEAVGLGKNPHAIAFLANLAAIDQTMDNAYRFMRDERNRHFSKWRDDWDNPDQYTERDALEGKIDRKFKAAMKQEDIHLRKQGELLGKQYEMLYGVEAGEAAQQAWDKIVAFRGEMVTRQQGFRANQKAARAAGVPLELRQLEAKKFWGETYKYMIVEMARLKQDAIAELDRIARGEPPKAAEPTPEQPKPPPPDQAAERARLRQEAEERAREIKRQKDVVWDVAETFSKMQPTDHSNFKRAAFQDGFTLLAVLKNEEFGGDPTIHDLYDASQKLTPEQVNAILTEHTRVKLETESAAETERAARFEKVKAEAAKRQAERKAPENITLLQAVRKHGGIDYKAVPDITGEQTAKGWQPGVFSKRGKNRWALDQMARLLADDGYPIDINRPDDLGGVLQLTALMQQAHAGKDIYPVGHDYEIEIAAAEAEMLARVDEEAQQAAVEAERVDVDNWTERVERAVNDGDLAGLIEQLETIPEGARPDGESHADWASRMFDEVGKRSQQAEQEAAIAENITRAQVAVEEMQTAADVAMTRQLLREKYEQAFPKVKADELDAWMEVSDAALETIGRFTGESLDQMYARYRDVLRGGTQAEQEFLLYQIAPPEETPQFREWFGDSKIVGKTGKPLVVYHGTDQNFNTFDTSKAGRRDAGWYGSGIYLTIDQSSASTYATHGSLDIEDAPGANVMPVYVSMQKPFYWPDGMAAATNPAEAAQITKGLIENGYDGVIVGNKYATPGSAKYYFDEIVVFDPKQIKSVANRGTFDPDNPNILYQGIEPVNRRMTAQEIGDYARALVRAGRDELRRAVQSEPNRADRVALIDAAHKLNPKMAESVASSNIDLFQGSKLGQPAKGGTEFLDGQAIIHAFEGGDISTIVHENAHIFLNLLQDAGKRTGNLALLDDLATFQDWARMEKFGTTWTAVNGRAQHTIKQYGDTYVYKSPSGYSREFNSFDEARYVLEQEMFARGFERYLAEGKAPTAKLARVFENFKQWLLRIYKKITGSVIDVNLTDDVRAVFDKMLGGEGTRQAEEVLFGAPLQPGPVESLGYDNYTYRKQGEPAAVETQPTPPPQGAERYDPQALFARDVQRLDADIKSYTADGFIPYYSVRRDLDGGRFEYQAYSMDGKQLATGSVTGLSQKLARRKGHYARVLDMDAGKGDAITREFVESRMRQYAEGQAEFNRQADEQRVQPPAEPTPPPAEVSPMRTPEETAATTIESMVQESGIPSENVIIGKPTPPAETQAAMFTTEDLPLFSQTPVPVTEEVFAPQPEIRQESFIETRPEFGQKYEENLVKVKDLNESTTLKLYDTFEHNGRRYQITEVDSVGVHAQDLTGAYPIGRVWDREQFARTGFKLADDITQDLVPAMPEPPTVSREKTLLTALVDRLERGEWFAKSRDFEQYIRNLGFDLESETDLNLAYDLMEGAYNMQARKVRADLDARNATIAERLQAMETLEQNLTEARRTLGKMKLQQFSTPLTLSEAAGYVADVRPGDIVGEPTGGTGNLVDKFSQRKDVTVRINEIDTGRQEVLRQIGYEPTGLNLMDPEWLIENGAKAGPWATVQITNPPWGSYSTGKYGKAMNVPVELNDWSQRFTYLELLRLADGGRMVGVMPTNWVYTHSRSTGTNTVKPSAFYKWLTKNYTVQAIVESPPGAYKHRGTDVSSLLVVIDKTPPPPDQFGPTVARYGDTQPRTWAEYAELLDRVPKRTEGATLHATEQLKQHPAGPDTSGIVDPAARAGRAVSDVENIGRPAKAPVQRTAEPERAAGPGAEPETRLPEERDAGNVAQPRAEEGPTLVEPEPESVSEEPGGFTYSDAFTERLVAGRAAVKDSRSFTEYVGRAPLQQSDVIHPHPNTVVETKGLAGVPYPQLEEAYRPSPSVMRAMKNRVLSYDGNLDPTWAAIQQNDKNHMGMLIADDVGMGKSRTAAAFVLDRIEKGKKRILVVTKDQQNVLNLMNQEFPQVYRGVANENGGLEGQPPTDYPAQRVFLSGENFPKVKKGEEPIPTFDKPTVYFVTSSEFMHFNAQLKQLAPDVVVVDEAHLFKNVGNTARGVAWIDLHKDWIARDVNMLYLTATPGVDLSDLQYLYGLKVWTMDGFGDWIKVITGQESPEKMKQRQAAVAQIDEWVTRVQEARGKIDAEPVTIEGRYGQEWQGLRVGEVTIWKSTEKWNSGQYYYEYKGNENLFAATNEMEAVIVAEMVGRKLAGMPAGVEISRGDIYHMFIDAESTFVETFQPPGREVVKSLGVAEIKEASDILKQEGKKKWGKSKGVGAFEATLPPAHTEQIMRELKVTGSYMARDISRAGVDFDTLEYVPPAPAKAAFNKRVDIYRKIYEAWRKFGKMNEGPKKMAAMFGVNGDIQADAKRALFNMRLPGVIEEADAAIARGEQAVISVVSVSEVDGEGGSLVSAIDKINTKSVEKVGKDEYTDPTDIPEAVWEVNSLKEQLKDLDPLPSPIDVLRERYGDRIAFVTGATSTKDRIQAQRDFQANKLDVIVISGAGKTGINLHDVTGKKRIELIVGDYEWSATNFKQELGRVDRTGQRSSPKVRVMHTGSAAERKFVATISNRMKGLGATSKGGSESTGTGAMTEVFELGNDLDRFALNAAWQDFPEEQKQMFLDHYFEDKNIKNADVRVMRDVIDMNSESLSKFLLGLQSMYIDDANTIMNAYIAKRDKLNAGGTYEKDKEALKTAANTGEILRSVDLGDNLRISEVRNADGQKFGVVDGVLTPHMNAFKGVVTGNTSAYDGIQIAGLQPGSWRQWVQFYDEGKNQYVTGLRIPIGKVKDLTEHFGKRLGSMHRPETALVDLRAGDKIAITGSEAAEWTLRLRKDGKITIDGARMKDRDALMKNGAAYNATGNFFYVPEDNLEQFFKRFPIRTEDEPPTPMLYQDAPITPEANPGMPMGGFEQAANFLPESEVRDEGWSQHVRPLLDAMRDTAIDRLQTKPLEGAVRDMSPEGQQMLKKYVAQVQGDMATTKLATMRWGENQRDAAMFNYNRRYGFDKMLEVPYPYEFFYTRAMMKWLGMALDGPAWFSNYARMRNQTNRYERDIPERLRNKIKIPAPWLPDWMGDGLYIDPFSGLFPPANFIRPFERMQQDKRYQLIEAERILQEWAADGSVSQAEIDQAQSTRSGATWERAFAEAQMRREAEISNPMDFFSTTFGPAWWLATPLNLAGMKVPGISKGDPNKVSNLPITNTARGFETVTKGTWAEPFGQLVGLLGKPEEWARKKMGLPQLGEYGEYYTKRQLANMVQDGLIQPEDAQRAMLEKTGPLWDQATERVKMELAMRVPLMGTTYAATHEGAGAAAQAFLPSLFGSGLLPQGELEYRGLKQDWNDAWKKYDAGDTKAVTAFFDEHPEYESYLAKGKDEDELLRSFLVGQIWDGYMALGDTNKKAARSQMGELFSQAFLDKETRSYESLDIETLTRWSRMFAQTPPTTPATQAALQQPAPQMNLYGPDVTQITDGFFQGRNKLFPDYYTEERGYYNLPKGSRGSYLIKHPNLKKYWDWKKAYYKKYPELQPVFSGKVFKTVDTSTWPQALEQYVTVYAMTGKPLTKGAKLALEQVWIREGQPQGDLKTWLDVDVVPAFMYQQPSGDEPGNVTQP